MEHGGFGMHGGIAKRGPSSLGEACVTAVSALALMPEKRKPHRVDGAHFHLPISIDVPLATRTRHWEPETLSLSD